MYNIYVVFNCLPGKREAFVKRVREEGILDAIRAEDGCRRYNYYFSEEDENKLLLVEAWETKRHQEIHIGQPHMETLRSLKDGYIASTELKEFEIR